MSELNLAELQLFSFEGGWDQFDTACFFFEEATLRVPIGPFQVGEKFDGITVDYEHSRVQLHRGEVSWTYRLFLSVGEAIES